ncbi:MAG: hypothetical protein ACLQSR_13250 [Limisphaerales bacterium]
MKQKMLILLVIGAAAVCVAVLLHVRSNKETETSPGAPDASQTRALQPSVITNPALPELHTLLVDDYHSTNSHAAITSAIAHELIAEQLRTNEAFLEWATNAVISTITQFVQNVSIPIYGSAGLTGDTLKIRKVTADAPVGLHAEAVFDPNPAVEGPLEFIVEGGIHPTLQLVQNAYRTERYQLNPTTTAWGRSRRNIGPMDWSGAVAPLDKGQVDELARKAFHAITGMNLESFNVETKIDIEKFPNPNGVHADATVATDSKIKILTPKDVVYPFAIIKYGDANSVRVPFFGEMVQTSPGRGEFVSLLAIVSKTEAVYELGEKFLGQGTWESNMLKQVNSMNTTQRGEVYRRLFAR